MAWSQGSKLERYKVFLKFMFEKYPQKCFFCGKKLSPDTFFPQLNGGQLDELTIHHIDHSGKSRNPNERPKNKEFAHRSCHRRYHRLYDLKKIERKEV